MEQMTDEKALTLLWRMTENDCRLCPLLVMCEATYEDKSKQRGCLAADLYEHVGELVCEKDKWNNLIDAFNSCGMVNPVTPEQIREAIEMQKKEDMGD